MPRAAAVRRPTARGPAHGGVGKKQDNGMSTFEEILEKDGKLVYKTKGVSMNPMLYQNRDLVVIEVPKGRLKKYDVALYKRGKSYVLHRVIGVLSVRHEK